jgi:hypothetical protein
MAWTEVHGTEGAMVQVKVGEHELDGLLEAVSAFIGRSSSFSEQIGETDVSDLKEYLDDFATSRDLRNLMDDPSPPDQPRPFSDDQVMLGTDRVLVQRSIDRRHS